MRARSVSGVSSRMHRHALLHDDGAGVDALVDVVDGRRRLRTPAASTSSIGVRAGEVRQQRGVVFTIAPGEALEERLPQQCM